MGVSPNPYKNREESEEEEIRIQTGTEGRPRKEQEGKDYHLQAKKRGLRRNQPSDTLISDF